MRPTQYQQHSQRPQPRGAQRAHPNQQSYNGRFQNPYGQKPPGTSLFPDKIKSLLQFTIAVLVAAIPISFYLVQPDKMRDATASDKNNLSEVISSLGSTIKQTASDVFRGNKNVLRVEQGDSNTSDSAARTQSPSAENIQMAQSDNVSSPNVRQSSESVKDVMDDSAMEHAAKHANPNYVCPMHPEVITNDPNAICPICGMDLVLLEAGGEAGTVKLTPTVINTLGVRTEKAKRRTLYRRIDSVGYVDVDAAKLRTINLRVDGWIETTFVKTEGDRVKKGQPLFAVYSPVLVNAQEEYIQAVQHNNELLIKASQERLRSLGMANEQITALNTFEDVQQQVPVFAPLSGIVSKLSVREGMFVKPAQPIMEIVDLDTVWVIAEVFETQADWVKMGQRAEATLPFMQDKKWEGMVDYIYPALEASTRSLKVRLQFENADESLKPNMYADVTIYASPVKKALTIPREALIITGDQKRVIVALGEGKFIPMPVSVGMQTNDKVEILNGLSEGDEVVTSSQFLIDSESSLKASLARMAGGH